MNRPPLFRVEAAGAYCGPFALAALTGKPPESFQPPKEQRGGMAVLDLLEHLGREGFKVTQHRYGRSLAERKAGRRAYPRLYKVLRPGLRGVAVVGGFNPGHYAVVDGFLVYDTIAGRRTWVHDHRCRNWDVHFIYEVSR